MRFVLEKVANNAAASGAPPSNPRRLKASLFRPPRCYYRLLLQHIVECVSST